jgi:hypothetical protein
MLKLTFFIAVLTAVLIPCGSHAAEPGGNREQVAVEARRGFEEILDLWRDDRWDELYDRLIPSHGSGKYAFVDQLNHSARRPACCWEKIQEGSVTFIDPHTASITARLGIEVEGVGTRFVTRTFRLVKEGGVWKLPEADIITLAEPNMQRIPKYIIERPM